MFVQLSGAINNYGLLIFGPASFPELARYFWSGKLETLFYFRDVASIFLTKLTAVEKQQKRSKINEDISRHFLPLAKTQTTLIFQEI